MKYKISLKNLKKPGITRDKLISATALFICPVITFYLFDLYTHNPFKNMDFKVQLLNIVFYLLMELLLLGIFRHVRIAMMMQTGIFMVLGLINYYVQNFRSAPIMPWDIYSISTAKSVAGNYSYSVEKETLIVLAGFVILLIAESRFSLKVPTQKAKRLFIIIVSAFCLHCYTILVQNADFCADFGLYDKLYTPTVMNMRDGNIVAFLMELQYIDVEKPDGYDAEEMRNFYDNISEKDNSGNTVAAADAANEYPNVIIIMDEAFSDPAVLGDFETNEDYMPFIHSLQQGADNTVSGYLNVSVLGGNTANTEFEFLTGCTMGFLPSGSVPYQQYVNNEMPSLASYFKELGYSTVAVHPYNASGWERNRVYPLIGFDNFYSLKNFTSPEKIRNYVSDEADFHKIKRIYESKQEGEPIFVFNVTMQNHGGYEESFDNFTPDITIKDADLTYLSMYLSLIKQSDSAFEDLVEYFSEQDEKTIILLFGDHQPAAYVTNPIWKINEKNQDDLTDEESLLRYKVPYVIWANYDIEEKSDEDTSANYLAIELLEAAGIELPPYQSFLKELREDYPIVSAVTIRDTSGNLYTVDECPEELEMYRKLQYYLLFDYDK
jgi:phosphoglycerol transferase MdoB-like AlkP superfamily enzyme